MTLTNTCSDDTCCDTGCVGLLEHLIVACGDLMSFQDLSQRCAYMEAKRTADRVQIAQASRAACCDDDQLAAAATKCSDDEQRDVISIYVRWQPEKGSVLYSLLKCLRDVIAGADCCCCC